MSGGIIIQRRAVLLTAVKDHCMYDLLGSADKAKVDAIAAKDPASVTQQDLEQLVSLLKAAIHC
jgi:hypothetical protein